MCNPLYLFTLNKASTKRLTGQAFALTTGSDISGVLVGSNGTTSTAGDDTFTATNLTYNSNDVLVGGEGNDSLTVTSTVANLTATPTVVGIENITFNITSSDLAAAQVALTNISLGTVTVNQNQAGAANTAAITGAGNVTVNFGTGITGTTTVAQTADTNLIINAGSSTSVTQSGGAGTGSVTINGGATTTTAIGVATTGSVTLAGDALTTLTGTGATINATTKADAATIKLTGTGTADTATLSIGAAAIIDNDTNAVETINISTGTTQTAASVATITDLAATTYNLTGANALTLANEQVTTASLLSGKTVTTDGAGAHKVELTLITGSALAADLTKVASAVAIDVKGTANATTALSVANNVTVNAIANLTEDLAIAGVAATAATNVLNLGVGATQTAGVTVTNTKTINLNVTANSDLGALAAGTADVFVAGSKNLELDAASVAAKVDATGFTGVLTATASDTTIKNIKGGAGNDVITATTADELTLDGGDGIDTINFGIDMTTSTFSNFEVGVLVDSEDNLFKASQLSGSTMAIKGVAGDDTDVVDFGTKAASIDIATMDFSKLVFDANVTSLDVTVASGTALGSTIALGNAMSVTGAANLENNISLAAMTGTTTIVGGSNADAITGGAGADQITAGGGSDLVLAGAGNDTITGGEGIDVIWGGTGADTIILTESTSVADHVVYTAQGEGSAVGAAGGTFSGYDTIIGFVSGTDKVRFDSDIDDDGLTVAGALTDIDALATAVTATQVVASTAATVDSADLTAADFANVDKVVTFMNDTGTGVAAGVAAAELDVVAITFGTFTALYIVDNAADAAIIAAEVELLGVFEGATLAAGDLVIA